MNQFENLSPMVKKEILQTAACIVKSSVLYKRKPWLQNGIVICDEEHFVGFRASPLLMENKAGAYVWIFKTESSGKKTLRGKMGFLSPSTDSITSEILKAAYSAAHQDMNFNEVQPEELDSLSYAVDLFFEKEKTLSRGEFAALLNRGDKNEQDDFLEKHALLVSKNYRQCLITANPLEKESTGQRIKKALLQTDISVEEEPCVYQIKYLRIV